MELSQPKYVSQIVSEKITFVKYIIKLLLQISSYTENYAEGNESYALTVKLVNAEIVFMLPPTICSFQTQFIS